MANQLHIRQIQTRLKDVFGPTVPASDITTDDRQREQKILTRCLAAFAILMKTDCSSLEACESVWDGRDDNGIDAAFCDFRNSKVILVQSKWITNGAGQTSARDHLVFKSGIKDIIEQSIGKFAARLHPKIETLAQLLNMPGTKIESVFICTGSSTLSDHAQGHINDLLHELNSSFKDDPILSYETIGIDKVYGALVAGGVLDKIKLSATISDWSKLESPVEAVFGNIDGIQINKWWKQFGNRLVTQNIRHSLGNTDINAQMRVTALQDPEHFWYFNNGITLIAEQMNTAPSRVASRSSGVFEFRDASVVNGAQTISTIGKIDDEVALEKISLLIRVIILTNAPQDFGHEVTRSNNLQNRIENRDFVARDEQQRRLQLEMFAEGIEYQYLRSDEFVTSESSCDLIELTTALACATGDSNLAVQAKAGIGRFFLDLTKPPYKILFSPKTSGSQAFNAVLVHRAVENWINSKKKTMKKKSGAAWGVLVHGNRVLESVVFDRLGKEYLDSSVSTFKSKLDIEILDNNCDEIHKRMTKYINDNFSGKFLAVLFKNPTESKMVHEYGKQIRRIKNSSSR
jgi:hypothetical protein